MYLLTFTILLLFSLIEGFLCRFLSRYGVHVSTTYAEISLLLSLLEFYEVRFLNTPCYLILTNWITYCIFSISWGFVFDLLTCVVLLVGNYSSYIGLFIFNQNRWKVINAAVDLWLFYKNYFSCLSLWQLII